ncbi:MAG TPA: TolC family protein [Holophaga sp.]|nr:TolC family protein [Holophaga sp.]
MLLSPPAQVQEAPKPAAALLAPRAAAGPASSQAALALDLSGALARARSDNPLLRAAKARVDERRGFITATRADALPQVTVIGDFTRVRDVSYIIAGSVPDVSPQNVYTTQVTLSQPIYYWGKLGTAIDIAKMGEREAGYAFTTAELETLHGVAKAYIAVLSAQAELEVVAARQKTAEQFLEDVTSKLEAQTATELDRLRAESEYLEVIPESLQAEANVKRALEVLNGQLGLDPKTPLALADLGKPIADASLREAERSEIAQFKQQEEMYRANEQIIKSDLRPKVDFGVTYGYQAGHTDQLFQEPYDAWKVNLTMRFPIFDGMRSAGKRAQNTAQLEQVHQQRLDKERSIAVEKSTADRELQKSIAFQEAAEKAHDAGLEALRMSRESFEQGLITSLDLLQAERTERQLESQRRRAQLAVWSAIFDDRRALGLPPL